MLVLTLFYRPDDVAASRQYSGLCEGLAEQGFAPEAWPSNRSRHNPRGGFPLKAETLGGVLVRRVWMPPLNQARFLGRILNALWVMGAWKFRALLTRTRPDILILGTDPIFAVLLAPFFRLRWPKAKIVHFCFDLYPEYAVAEGLVKEGGLLVRFLRRLLGFAYRRLDLTVDIGPCMRERLAAYPQKRQATLTPWALEEPGEVLAPDPEERKALFGGPARLCLLYSGNLSHPHEFYLTLKLARLTPGFALFCYSARGNRLADLQKAVNPEDQNFHFAPFAPPGKLEARLSAPDIHLVSLKAPYKGVAVPSKFFGALAAGRPVLFEGPRDSAIARWIEEYGLGWVLTDANLGETAADLKAFASDAGRKKELFRHCRETYQAHFSRKAVLEGWKRELGNLSG
jgi:putative colanic acid biosynthesis glycosyltransferase WcaI